MEKLKKILVAQALEICGEEDRIRKNKISIAPLQISKQTRNWDKLDKSGHFHYREDIVKIYNEKPSDVITHAQIFDVAEQRAQLSAKGCSNSKAKAKHILKYGNLIFLSGQAGVGKSTFSKVLVQEMLDPNLRLYQAEFVFFIRFRDLNYHSSIDLFQFLTNSAEFISNATSEDREMIVQHLEASDKVYFVLDGLDEADLDLGKKCPAWSGTSPTTAETLIHHLLTGRLLPKSKKLVTSRPRQLAHLPDEYLSNLYLNLLGLNNEGQSQICHDLCRDDPVQEEKILDHINSRPDLKSLCYIPITCIMIMMSFCNTNFLVNHASTLTAILVYALDEWFLKKFERDFQTKNISNLAFEAFLSNQFYFREHHLKSHNINSKTTTTFLTTSIKFQLLQGKEVSYFAHLMWQEFFVAIKLRLYASKEEFQSILPHLVSDKFEVVTRFLYGLCNKRTMDELLDCIDIKEINSRTDRKDCEIMLKEFAIERLQSYRDAEGDPEMRDPYFFSILSILGWVREMDDVEFTKQAAACLRDEFEINGNEILPSDVANLNHVLRARCTALALTLDVFRFDEGCSQYFYKDLVTTINKNPNILVSCRIVLTEDFSQYLCIDQM